jgi:hypothetical protein
MPDQIGSAIKIQCASARVRLVINVPTNLARYIFSFRKIAGLEIRHGPDEDRKISPSVGTVVTGCPVVVPLDAAVAFVFRPLA